MYIAVFALFLGTFSIGTTEFVISGILPAIAADLGVSVPSAGLLVTFYALGVAIGGPIMTLLLASMPRKSMALAMMGLFIAGQIICALADGYVWVMVGRVVTAVGHGAFFGLAVVLATKVARPEAVGRALSFIFAGVAIANIIGVPAGTWIGTVWGWRTTFWLVCGLAVLAVVGITLFVPRGSDADAKTKSVTAQFRALANMQVLTSFALIFLMMVAMWSLNTFIAPFLIDVVGMPAVWLAPVLLGFGLVATAGTFIGGPLADRAPIPTMRWSYIAFAAGYLAISLLAGMNVYVGIGVVTLVIFPLTLVATTVQNRVLIGAKKAPDLASSLISSVFNSGTAVGSLTGASALSAGLTYGQLPFLSLGAATLAAILAVVVTQMDWRSVQATTGRISGS
jgi:MFS transporter, DHA1 family, inner membrane transport protein